MTTINLIDVFCLQSIIGIDPINVFLTIGAQLCSSPLNLPVGVAPLGRPSAPNRLLGYSRRGRLLAGRGEAESLWTEYSVSTRGQSKLEREKR
jgi:hypothetical protein